MLWSTRGGHYEIEASINYVARAYPWLFATHAAFAQDYPAKPVQIIEPFGAGGGPDLLARALAPRLSEL